MLRGRSPVLATLATCALAIGAYGCGSGGGGSSGAPGGGAPGAHSTSATSGAQVFATAGCAGCHTLSAAHSHGQVGPNLDTLAPSEEQVEDQVERGGGGMPSFKGVLSQSQIQAVARYVSKSAG